MGSRGQEDEWATEGFGDTQKLFSAQLDTIWADATTAPNSSEAIMGSGGSDSDGEDSVGDDTQDAVEFGAKEWVEEAGKGLTAVQQDFFEMEKLFAWLDKILKHISGENNGANDFTGDVIKRKHGDVDEKGKAVEAIRHKRRAEPSCSKGRRPCSGNACGSRGFGGDSEERCREEGQRCPRSSSSPRRRLRR